MPAAATHEANRSYRDVLRNRRVAGPPPGRPLRFTSGLPSCQGSPDPSTVRFPFQARHFSASHARVTAAGMKGRDRSALGTLLWIVAMADPLGGGFLASLTGGPESVGVAAGFDDVRVEGEPVEDGGAEPGVGEGAGPLCPGTGPSKPSEYKHAQHVERAVMADIATWLTTLPPPRRL
jgi:hypothetical protein